MDKERQGNSDMVRHRMHHWIGRLLSSFIFAVLAVSLLGSATRADQPAELVSKVSETIPLMERRVSLSGEQRSRRAAMGEICRQAGVEMKVDTDALTAVGLNCDESVSVKIVDEPLQYALRRIVDSQAHPGVYHEVRSGMLFLTTIQAAQARTLQKLPVWLQGLYTHGLLATVDNDGNVISIHVGEVMTDELLTKLETLPKLRELDIQVTKAITPAGLAHLSNLGGLEKLTLYAVNTDGAGLGDDALKSISALTSLRDLSLIDCGTTDAGCQFLEGMQQLTSLRLQDGRLTNVALFSVAKLKRLKSLDLSSYVATVAYGRMSFSPAALQQLAALQELEVLCLAGHAPKASFFGFPKLKSLSVGGVDDAAAATIAQCRTLTSLELTHTEITDGGLKAIATLPALRSLNLSSSIISDAGMSHLTGLSQLEHLQLRASNVTDETLKYVAAMHTLTRLDLYGSNGPGAGNRSRCFTANGLEQLEHLSNLRILWLSDLDVTGGYSVLKQLTGLRQLTLMMSGISDEELESL